MGRKTHGPYLLAAIEYNDLEKVTEILGTQVRGKEKIKEFLCAPVRRLASENQEVPLILAAAQPTPAIIRYMVIKHEVSINFVVKEHLGPKKTKIKTALITAVRKGHYETVDGILSLSCDSNIQDHKGRTALHHAVRKADFRMAKMLLVRGAQVNILDAASNSPLHIATIFGHLELVKLLLKYNGDLYQKGQHGAVPMHIAAREGHAALVRLYSNYEVNVNTRVPCYDARDKAPLHVACEQGHSETTLALLEYCGADVNIADSEKETPLHCTVINLYDPLGMKSKEDYAETVKILVRYGADVNLRNARGETALLLAARNEFVKIVDLLVQAGTDPLIEDNDGNKAIDLVVAEDTVSRQTLKMAMENRERIMSESLELRAKGFSTSMHSLPIRSQSALNMAAALGTDMGRSTSQQRMFSSQHQLALALQHPTVYEDGYLPPVDSRHHNHSGRINQSHSSSSGSQGHPKLPNTSDESVRKASSNSLKEESPISEGTMPPMMMKRAKSEDSLLGSPASKNRNQGRALPPPPAGRGRKPVLETRESIMSKQSEAPSFWQVTPRASTTSYQEEMSYESLPSQNLDKQGKAPGEKPLLFLAPGQQQLADDDEDTYFDDESFDTLDDLDEKKTQKPSLPPKPKPKRNKPPEPTQAEIESHKKAMAQNDPNLQHWLTEQAVLLKERDQAKNAGPIAHSTPPRERAKKAGNLQTFQNTSPPPRPERNFSTSSADTVKENKPRSPKAKSSNKVHVNKKNPGQTLITIQPRRAGDSTSTVTENTSITEDVYSTTGRPISDVSTSTAQSESTVFSEISSVSQRREKNNNEPPKIKPRVARRTNPPKLPDTAPPPRPPKMSIKELSSSEDSSSSYSDSDSEDTEVLKKPLPQKPAPKPKPAEKKPQPPPKQDPKKPVPPPKKAPVKVIKDVDSGEESPAVSFSSGEEDEADSKTGAGMKSTPTIKIQAAPGPQALKPPSQQQPSQPPSQPTKANVSLHQKTLLGNSNKTAADEDSVAMDYRFYKSNKEIITSSGSDIQVSVAKKLHDNEIMAAQRQQELEQQQQQQLQYEQDKERERQEEMDRKRQQEVNRVRLIQQQAEQARLQRQKQLEQQKLQQQAMEQQAQHRDEQERLQREAEQQRMQEQQFQHQQQLQAEQQRLQHQQPEQYRLQQEQLTADAQWQQQQRESSPVQNGEFEDKHGKRKSVTIGSDTIIPTTPRKAKDHDHRTINYNGAEAMGYKIVGGNAEGVFVHQLDQNAEARRQGLLDGDQILKINSQSTTGKTKEEAIISLMNIKTVVSLVVRNKADRYKAILHHGGTGDSFHVRAKFNLDVKGELQVDDGDIFSVKDTLPDGRMGFWRASKVSGKHMTGEQVGLIPNKQRAEQISLAHQLQQTRPVETVQRGGFLRRSFQKGRSRSKSVDRLGGPGSEQDPYAIHPGQIVPYEKVEQRSPGFRRPVFLLGLFCDVVKDMLLRDSPGVYEDPGGEVEVDTGGATPPNQDPINVRLIKSISSRDKHCLTILSPKAIQHAIEKTDLCPLVIYLSPGSKQIVKIQKGKMAPGFERKPGYMYDEAMNFEKVHNRLFTATVPYTQDESWFLILKDTIDGIQKTPFWMPAKTPPASDEEEEEEVESPRAVIRVAPPSNTMPRMSRTTDDIPDEIENVLTRHAVGPPLAGSSPTHAPSPGLGSSPAQGPSPVRRPVQPSWQKPPTPTEEHYLPMSKQHSLPPSQSPTAHLNGSFQNGAPRSILKNGQTGPSAKDGDSASQSSEHSASSSSQPSVIMGGSPARMIVSQSEDPPSQPQRASRPTQRISRPTDPIQRQIPQAAISTRHQTLPVVQPLQRQISQPAAPPGHQQGAPTFGNINQPMPQPHQQPSPQVLAPGQRPPFQGRPPYHPQQGYPQGPGPRQYRPPGQRYQGPPGHPGPRQPPPGHRFQGPRPRQPPPQGAPGQRMVFRPAGPPVQQVQQQDSSQPSPGIQRAQMAAHPGYQQAGYNPQMITTRRPSGADAPDAHKETTL